ncbi:MAG: hypothetical protein ACE5OQ_02215, partial [Woeseia sp.]
MSRFGGIIIGSRFSCVAALDWAIVLHMAPDAPSEIRPKPLSGLHLLLTYACNYQCDHCFVWGGPWQSGTMTLATI